MAYLLSPRDTSVTDFASPWKFNPKAGAFMRSVCDARLELTSSNARQRFGRVFMSIEYQLMHQEGLDRWRVAPDSLLHKCGDLVTLAEVPQVMRDLEVSHSLPVAAPLLVCFFGIRALAHVGGTLSPYLNRFPPRNGCSKLQRCTFLKLFSHSGLGFSPRRRRPRPWSIGQGSRCTCWRFAM